MWSQTVRQREIPKTKKIIAVKQVKCQRTGYDSTTTQARTGNKDIKTVRKKRTEYNWRKEIRKATIVEQHAYSKRTGSCCTDEAEGEEDTGIRTAGTGKETEGETRQKARRKREGMKEKIVLQAVIVT